MLIKEITSLKSYMRLLFILCVGLMYHSQPLSLYGDDNTDASRNSNFETTFTEEGSDNVGQGILYDKQCHSKHHKHTLTYYLNISDFALSFISIPTSNVAVDSTTIASSYLAGRAPLYDLNNIKVGHCSASFLNMQTADGIFTDISNFISVDNGLIVTWFTPTTLINLELDSIIHSMVTECIVKASTKVGFNPFYGKTFNLVVSSDDQKIYFQFTKR